MAFSLPVFNLTCILRHGNGDPQINSVCNLAWGRRVQVSSTGGTNSIGIQAITMSLLLPALTDVRGRLAPGGSDIVEVPAGSGRLYTAEVVDDIGKGFANEHRCALILQASPWPIPYP